MSRREVVQKNKELFKEIEGFIRSMVFDKICGVVIRVDKDIMSILTQEGSDVDTTDNIDS